MIVRRNFINNFSQLWIRGGNGRTSFIPREYLYGIIGFLCHVSLLLSFLNILILMIFIYNTKRQRSNMSFLCSAFLAGKYLGWFFGNKDQFSTEFIHAMMPKHWYLNLTKIKARRSIIKWNTTTCHRVTLPLSSRFKSLQTFCVIWYVDLKKMLSEEQERYAMKSFDYVMQNFNRMYLKKSFVASVWQREKTRSTSGAKRQVQRPLSP